MLLSDRNAQIEVGQKWVLGKAGLLMGQHRSPREARAAHLRRLEIEDLVAEYRMVLQQFDAGPLPPHIVREVMMRSILDKEFGVLADEIRR